MNFLLRLFRRKVSPQPLNRYQVAAQELREVKAQIDAFLARGHAAAHRNMKQVAPGLWIHKDYRDLPHCLQELRTWLPS
jgi:hypothetical protein